MRLQDSLVRVSRRVRRRASSLAGNVRRPARERHAKQGRWRGGTGPREAAPLPGACGCTASAPEDGRGSLQPCGRPRHGGPSREVLPPPAVWPPPGRSRRMALGKCGAPGLAVREPAPGLAPRVEFPGRLCGSVRFPLNGFTYS